TATSSKRAEDRKDPEIDARLTNLLGPPLDSKGLRAWPLLPSLLHGPRQGPSPEALRSIFLSLGVTAEELKGEPHTWRGVYSDFHGCVWKLDLDRRPISGRLDALSNLTALRYLYLSDTGVTGSLQALAEMTELQKLWLDGTKVAGDLQPLFNLTMLKELFLRNTGVNGGLEPLGDMSELQMLWLDGTRVAGDLQPLFKLTKLEELLLDDTRVSGGLQALGDMTELRQLWLHGTQVAGDPQPLFKLTKLEELLLQNTGVTGGLQALAEMTELWKLSLEGTKVAGDLQALSKLTKLKQLSLKNTVVQGDLGVLMHLTNLMQADLSGTRVSGRLTPAWRGQLLQLHTLDLKDSQVNFLPVGSDLEDLRATFFTEKTQQLLPALVTLDVSLCPLDGAVENLLEPLSFAGHLASVRATGANLSGHLRTSCLREVSVDGETYGVKCTIPLLSSLQGLELADNKIHRIEGIPPTSTSPWRTTRRHT
ncbi:GSO1, partial [Symbiodinium necroappetens]